MSKEMIVSVNGREKKIAIVENGLVTEFYIERGESSEAGQGIVGNIYKGRVMRVLPGMQSAFVDIGLERDAFLYVSDFFDEEEEFERIVVEPTKSAAIAAATAAGRETPPARLTPTPTPDGASAAEPTRIAAIQPPVQTDARADAEDEASPDAEAGRRRGRRRRGRADENQDTRGLRTAEARTIATEREDKSKDAYNAGAEEERQKIRAEEIGTPFVASVADFERVVDPEEAATADGEMLKDAMVQERLTDQIRRIEFDIEEKPARTIGSLLDEASSGAGSFERVTDSDALEAAQTKTLSAGRTSPEIIAASIRSFDDASEGTLLQPAASFERISDDEGNASLAETVSGEMGTTKASETEVRGRRSRGRRGGKRQDDAAESRGAVSGDADKKPRSAEPDEVAADQIAISDKASANETETAKKRRGTTRTDATKTARKSGAKKLDAESSSTAGKSRTRRPRRAAGAKGSSTLSSEEATESGELLGDAQASVKKSPTRGEFARRRRRSSSAGSNRRPENATDGEAGDLDVAIPDEAAVVPSNGEAILVTDDATIQPAEDTASMSDGSSSVASDNGGEPSSSSSNRREGRGGRDKRDGRDNRESRDNRDNRNGRGGRERTPTPTIADLLREGQEILVQIAKEPISQKGARITSHIALPGRFLVYMPTVEHVGVSRKIESDSERQRLRKLIAAIRNEEDVPSGGFIVRTAGTGITEQDLREDARYLVRTWRDIRKTAERTKAPTAVHRDLDLVQRILRDQLSEDFTAIRVDSEEEYLQIAEFINRIQPRLVNRVKLYTREEPILETYGVQAEIEKAIKPRVWLKSGGYLVINQTEALVAIDVNTGKFVGRGGSRLEDTITKTNLEAVDEIARQIRLRDLGGIIVLDLIDMEERRNRQRVMQALQEALENDKSPNKVLSFNDFGLVIMTRKRVKQSLERTLCAPCSYCQGAGLVKSPQTVVYEILEEARRLARGMADARRKSVTLRANPEVARALRTTDRDVLREIEDYLGAIDVTSDESVHQEQFDFAFV